MDKNKPTGPVQSQIETALLKTALRFAAPAWRESPAEQTEADSWAYPSEPTGKVFLRDQLASREPPMALDRLCDTKYAPADPAFRQVLHVFCQTWMGIRAAAGSLPGRKLAIAQGGDFGRKEKAEFLALLASEQISRVVFHGMPENSRALIAGMAQAGTSEMAYLVYHGNPAQWGERPERTAALAALSEAASGRLKRVHFMQRDCPLAGARSYLPMLVNHAPRHAQAPGNGLRQEGVVFLPGTDIWRKNLHGNALGAALSPHVARVLHYAPDLVLPPPYSAKLRRASYTDRAATFGLMARAGCTLNVSLVECHPMVGLESESVGTPCLRGRLNLDAGEDHAYARLVRVDDPTNVFDIKIRLDSVFGVPQKERLEMIKDYTALMDQTSRSRYVEFLEL